MASKKVNLNDLRGLIQKALNEEYGEKMGINLRSLLDGELAMAMDNIDLSNYKERNDFISRLESRLMENDWISMSNGTKFEKTFSPTNR